MSTTAVVRACARSGTRLLAGGALVLGLLAGTPTAPAAAVAPSIQTADTTTQTRARMVSNAFVIARNQKGDPYRYGAAGPNAFDCSGLMYYSFRRAGFSRIPRTSSAQARFVTRIRRDNMRIGDFIFFTGSSGVYHAGLYAGMSNGRRLILHAGRSGTRVRTDPVWSSNWFAGTLRFR